MDREDKMGLVSYNFEPEYSVEEMNTNSVAETTSQQAFPTLEEWCDCGNCQQMPSPEECVCCRHAEFVYPNLEDHQCIMQIESFDNLILNPDVLALSFIQMMMFRRQRGRAPDQLNSRQSRLVAYRQFVCLMLKGERHGKSNRVVIPSCVVRKIRDSFLDDDGDYTGFKQYEVLPHIDDFDCRMAAESIIEKLISKYQFSSPQEYQNANGFKVKLPDIQYVNYKSDMQITKEQPSELTNEQHNNNNISCQDNQFNVLSNNYVKTKDLSEKTNKCFVKIKEGMIVKLKVTTDESEVAFGWYKTNPWTQKKCGFFRKSTENIE